LFVAILIKILRRRLRARNSAPIVEDPAALEAAQKEADQSDFRRALAKTHILLDSFSSMQYYTMDYMDRLVEFLLQNGVDAHYYFQESMPAGVISVTGATGTYELYVPRGMEEQTRALVKQFRSQ
jgi:hypothetical protein